MKDSDSNFLQPHYDAQRASSQNPNSDQPLRRLQSFACLVPILGAIPAAWVLLTSHGNDQRSLLNHRKQKQVSRLSLILALLWLTGSIGLNASSQNTETLAIPFLVTSTLWTSGYFLLNLGLMVRLWKNLPLLPK